MSVYKRGGVYWFNFVFDGRHIQRSTKVSNKNDARDIEKAAWTQLARHEVGLPTDGDKKNPTIGEILDALEADIKFRLGDALDARNRSNLKRARAVFPQKRKAATLTDAQVDSYIAKRQRDGVAPATINRTIQLIGQAFKNAVKRRDIERAPEFRHLSEEGNARKGFFSDAEFRAVHSLLPEDLRDFCLFAYVSGWRKSEISSLTWSDVEEGVIRLRGENAKNGETRSVVIAGELAGIIERRKQARLAKGVLTNLVFHRDGSAVLEFRKAWASACVGAGVGKMVCPKCDSEGVIKKCENCRRMTEYRGRIFHDLRRTAVRNMVRSGVPQSVAMKISGHRTASLFRRYDIANEEDLRAAIESVERYHQTARHKITQVEARR